MAINQNLVVHRVWRSQLRLLALFLLTSPLSIWLSQTFPGSVLSGPLFSISNYKVSLQLPFFWFIPAFFAFKSIINIYDVRYLLDSKGLEAKIGILSLNQTTIKLRFEDIRSIDSRQSVLDRLLGIGSVDIGTAASAGLEMTMDGIADPSNLQKIIQSERDAIIKRDSVSHRGKKIYSQTVDVSKAAGE